MSRSVNDFRWGCFGLMLILFGAANLVIYLTTGGFYNRQGKFFKLDAWFALLGTAVFLLLGFISIAVSFVLRAKRKRTPPEAARWRRRVR